VHDAFTALTYQPTLGATVVVVVCVVVTGAEAGHPPGLQQQMRELCDVALQLPEIASESPTHEPSDESTDGCSAEEPDETVLHGMVPKMDETYAKLLADCSAACEARLHVLTPQAAVQDWPAWLRTQPLPAIVVVVIVEEVVGERVEAVDETCSRVLKQPPWLRALASMTGLEQLEKVSPLLPPGRPAFIT
jgi:hypothetical protein